jgi:tetratricopeptide (TPR) repeat protein
MRTKGEDRILAYFGLSDLSRPKAILILAGVAVAAVVVSSVLVAGFDRDLDRIAQVYEQGDVLTAIDELEQYLESHPGNSLAWTFLGNMNTDVGAYEDAEAAFNRAIEINPGCYEAWTGLGVLNRELGDNERAMECYEKALEINPNYAEAHTSMAISALELYQDAEALEHAEKAYELEKRNPGIVANLAVVYHYNKMYEERDAMTAEAERLGYDDMDGLWLIYLGLREIRD